MPNHFRNILTDENNVDIIPPNELFERFFNLADTRVLIHDEEVWLTILIHLSNPTQEEAHTSVLIPNDGNQLALDG